MSNTTATETRIRREVAERRFIRLELEVMNLIEEVKTLKVFADAHEAISQSMSKALVEAEANIAALKTKGEE